MRFPLRSKVVLLFLCLPLIFVTHNESHAGVKAQDFPERGQFILRCIEEYFYFGGIGLERPITFEEETYIPADQPIVAKEVSFAPDSRLVFTDNERVLSKSRFSSQCGEAIYIITDSLVIHGDATITWDHAEVPNAPLDRGTAPSGASGAAFGESGREGAKGAPGNPGYAGRDAPSLFLVARMIQGGPLHIDFSGQEGGVGGKGQTGGNGGNGRMGRSASQSLFDCKRGPGPSGNGGNGGQGGPGGRGGDGGQGGTVVAILPDSLDSVEYLDVHVDGGTAGQGGKVGQGGKGGRGGKEGAVQAPLCRSAGQSGSAGNGGPAGEQRPPGEDGPAGDLFVLSLSDEDFERLMSARRGYRE